MSLISFSLFDVCSRSGKAMLSKRFSDPNRAPSWKRTPSLRRTRMRSRSRIDVISSPSIQTSPRSGFSSPMMCLSSTDLPVPDGPMMALISPRGMSKDMSSSTVWDPKDFVSPLIEMMASETGSATGGLSGSSVVATGMFLFFFRPNVRAGVRDRVTGVT